MSAREAVLTAAHLGVRADNAEEGYAQIRSITGTEFPDAELAGAVAEIVHDGLIHVKSLADARSATRSPISWLSCASFV